MVVFDDQKCICCASVGCPGSVHDNHILSNCKTVRNPVDFLGNNEYLIGDSAFMNSSIMGTSYKSSVGHASLTAGQHWFNDVLNSPRAGVKNAIGVWDGRFPRLRNIRMRINGKASMVKVIKYTTVTIILTTFALRHHSSMNG